MKTKITTTTAAVLLGMSSLASANPPAVPSIYNNGPAAPILNMTDMRDVEKAAFALNEALMQATEGLVYAKGTCANFSIPIEVYSHPNSNVHYIQGTGPLGTIRLDATVQPKVAGFGQNYDVDQAVQGTINGTPVQGLKGRYTYNHLANMMVGEKTAVQVKSQTVRNGNSFDQFYSSVIKDFYHGNTYDANGDFYEIFDYGLQSLSKNGYPVNKWWQKSKAVRDNGDQGCTVFQKDRLVGSSECRIVISTAGYSQEDLFWQTGTLSVQKVKPNINETELNACTAGN